MSVDLSTVGEVLHISLDRAERRNALDIQHCRDLEQAVRNAGDSRAILLSGVGPSFCSGADFDVVTTVEFRTALYSMLDAITNCAVPTIVYAHGHAIGGGLQLALAADLRVAHPATVFAVPTARIGLAVDPWTITRLIHLAGGGPARSMLLTCDSLDAERGYQLGLIDRLGNSDDAMELAAHISRLAPLTMRYIKQAANESFDFVSTPEVRASFEACWSSNDMQEGLRARIEKRPARFEGS